MAKHVNFLGRSKRSQKQPVDRLFREAENDHWRTTFETIEQSLFDLNPANKKALFFRIPRPDEITRTVLVQARHYKHWHRQSRIVVCDEARNYDFEHVRTNREYLVRPAGNLLLTKSCQVTAMNGEWQVKEKDFMLAPYPKDRAKVLTIHGSYYTVNSSPPPLSKATEEEQYAIAQNALVLAGLLESLHGCVSIAVEHNSLEVKTKSS